MTTIVEDTKELNGVEGHAFAKLEWLLTHHKAKEDYRKKIAKRLGLSPGMAVLDIGCGPGLWSNLMAEQVAPNGSVLGIDLDHMLIDFAKKNAWLWRTPR